MAKAERIQFQVALIAVIALIWIFMGAEPIRADAASTVASGTCGDDLTWVLDDEGTLTISGTGAMTDWDSGSNIPWYNDRSSVTSASIGSGVTTIGKYAFYECENMTEITIPDSVSAINSCVFYNCDSLTTIIIPDAVTSIESNAFYSCDSLTAVTVGKSVTSIGKSAFEYCKYLSEITIPDNVTSIGSNAFGTCSSLKSVNIGSGLSSLGSGAFRGNSLNSIIVSDDNSKFKSIDNALFSADETRLYVFPAGIGGTYTIPDTVAYVQPYAFSYCSGLTEITVPDTVASIGQYAFEQCTGLTKIIIPDSVTSIDSHAFSYCTSLNHIDIGSGLSSLESTAFVNDSQLKSISVSDRNNCFKVIDNVLFSIDGTILYLFPGGLDGSYIIPDSVINISNYAFFSCSNLTGISIPGSVTSIGNSAFSHCSSLTKITLPSGIVSIGSYAFSSCSSLVDVIIPKSVTSIDYFAFYTTLKLRYVFYEGSASEWDAIDKGSSIFALSNAALYYNSTGTIDFSDYSASLSDTNYTYSGSAKKPTVEIKENYTTLLTQGTDYIISYSNNTNAGTATVIITGKGRYVGTIKKKFTISKANNSIKATNKTKTSTNKNQSFSIGATRKGNAKLSYSSNNSKVSVNSNGKVTIKKNYVGQATITITAAATTNYKKATKKITVTIKPATVSVTKLSSESGKLKIKWEKTASVDGYQVYVSTSSSFKSNTRAKKVTKTEFSIKNLTKNRTYYVKVRAYKKLGNKMYYGAWSKVKKIKAK